VALPYRQVCFLHNQNSRDAFLIDTYNSVWRPLCKQVEDTPLAFCDPRSVNIKDLKPVDRPSENFTAEIYILQHTKDQRWYYLSRQKPDEVFVFVSWDSYAAEGCASGRHFASVFVLRTCFDSDRYTTQRVQSSRLGERRFVTGKCGSEVDCDHGRSLISGALNSSCIQTRFCIGRSFDSGVANPCIASLVARLLTPSLARMPLQFEDAVVPSSHLVCNIVPIRMSACNPPFTNMCEVLSESLS
jgi:hypothetical protein